MAETPGPVPGKASHYLKDVRSLRFRVRMTVYPAILMLMALNYFVLGFSQFETLVTGIAGLSIAILSTETAFVRGLQLRKRAAYPRAVLEELGSIQGVSEAGRRAQLLVSGLLGVRSSFIIVRGDDGNVSLASVAGMSYEFAGRLVRVGVQRIGEAMRTRQPVRFDPASGKPPETRMSREEHVVFIPVVGLEQSIGVLAVAGDRRNRDLEDDQLLSSIGVALGLCLESLRQQDEVRQTLSLLSATLDSTADGILVVGREGKMEVFNERFIEMWRVPESIVAGREDEKALAFVLDQLKDPEGFLARVRDLYSQPDAESYDVLEFKDGRVFERYSQPQRVGGEVVGRAWSFRDVTARMRAEGMIKHLAYHDGLTDLPNRTLFQDRLTVALAQARRKKQMLAVMFLDLDQFKVVNDTVGHREGDTLLRSVGDRLAGLVREEDTIARVGGDEFAILLSDIGDAEDAVELANRLLERFRKPFKCKGQSFYITASIGIALYPSDGEDGETLLRNADMAMYRVKERGKNSYQLFTRAINARIEQRAALERDLRRGLEHGEFVVYYQPQVDIDTGRIVGTEALVRWRHSDWELALPADFLSVAEDTGLIVPLGEFVLRTACAQHKAWQEAGSPLRVAVNISARQLQQGDLISMVAQVLEETGLEPHRLHLEITENTAMDDVDFTIDVLRRLRGMGVQIAMDDFGTGYSSLSYLKRFPINAVKIDRSFVRDLTIDPSDAAIATAVITMAHTLNLRVVAEGVETKEQLTLLKEQQCDEFQGNLFSKPVPAEKLEEILVHGRGRSRAEATVDSS